MEHERCHRRAGGHAFEMRVIVRDELVDVTADMISRERNDIDRRSLRLPAGIFEAASTFCNFIFEVNVDHAPEIFSRRNTSTLFRCTLPFLGRGGRLGVVLFHWLVKPKKIWVVKCKATLQDSG